MSAPASHRPASHRPADYRPDIDGLRAVAVLAVVGFHAGIGFLRGGFVGVDVFFVISGYLISGIILNSLARDRFSVTEFYVRRINRIFPALLLVVTLTLIAGWIVLFPLEFANLGKHALAGSSFISNFVLWRETGYFDTVDKPLLHLWSLAVEEQFYLFWPLVLVIAWKGRWNLGLTVGTIGIASFLINVWAVSRSQNVVDFYFPVTRLWELLAGGLLHATEVRRHWSAPASNRIRSEVSSAVGLTLIVATVGLANESEAWPGWLALLPVAGTVLLIAWGQDSAINRRFLGNKFIVAIGLISYPLYLWHNPIFIFARIINDGPPRLSVRLALALLSVALAAVTYQFLEKPIRFGARKRRSAAIMVPLLACTGIVGLAVYSGDVTARLAPVYRHLIPPWAEQPRAARWTLSGDDLIIPSIPGDSSGAIALVGDSHASHYVPRLERLSQRAGASAPRVMVLTYGQCPPMPGVDHIGSLTDKTRFPCRRFHEKLVDILKQPNVRTVVYSAYWEFYLSNRLLFFLSDRSRARIPESGRATDSVFTLLETEIRGLRSQGKRVFIVLSSPVSRFNDPINMLPRRLPGLPPRQFVRTVNREEIDADTRGVREQLMRIGLHTGAVIVDPIAFLCDLKGCPTMTAGGLPKYVDSQHLRPLYVRDSVTYLDMVFEK